MPFALSLLITVRDRERDGEREKVDKYVVIIRLTLLMKYLYRKVDRWSYLILRRNIKLCIKNILRINMMKILCINIFNPTKVNF